MIPASRTGASPDLIAALLGYVAQQSGSAVLTELAHDHGRASYLAVERELRAAVETAVAGLGMAGSKALDPVDLGRIYEGLLSEASRDQGAHYTPPDLAASLVRAAWPPGGEQVPMRVWDPACGGGVFLLAVADRLVADGCDPRLVVTELTWGTDVDPGAVAVTRAALAWWAERHGVVAEPAELAATAGLRVSVGDSLLPTAVDDRERLGRFDLVVGNPPFQSQLTGATVRSGSRTDQLRTRWGSVVGAYTDTAALFMVAAAQSLAPEGQLGLLLPTSVLAARDARGAREALDEGADVVGLWIADEQVFEAAVDVCAVVARARPHGSEREPRAAVTLWRGSRFDAVPTMTERTATTETAEGTSRLVTSSSAGDPSPWAGLALRAMSVPDPAIRIGGRLGDICRAVAGFRDEYYGLVDHVREAPPGMDIDGPWPEHLRWLITSGLIEPGWCAWGYRPTRFAKQRFLRPVVDQTSLAETGGRAAEWVCTTAVPKVVVATQTRVGEAAVDSTGRWVPSTPTIALLAPPDRLWEIAAVVCSPVGTVASLAANFGTGRSAMAIKPTTKSLVDLPLPVDATAWAQGAQALRGRRRDDFIGAMATAYALAHPDELHRWWQERTPWPRDWPSAPFG